ncbi:hypothetical protein [Faecalimicrobium dakarense]|uniref:hypothetical protein n=1 Tax=Faecalimicrobium dakarense TaxID=1301100 RepID=UPI0004B4D17D|nr:hypothetical protein [[Clostridium] dakarense]
MKIDSYVKIMSEKEAKEIANKRGNTLGKILLKNNPINNMKVLYIENKIITLNMIHEPNIISKNIFKANRKKQKITFIADGSTGSVAYYESGPGIENINADEDNIQFSIYEDNVLIEKSKKLARRIVRRKVGGDVSLEIESIKSVFRPFHVAFYGELEEGKKVRYLPIAADGCNSKRTF